MDILDRLLGHDAWTTRQLLLVCRDLPDAQLDHGFSFGQGTLRRTLVHLISNMEGWTAAMNREGHPAPAGGESIPALLARLDLVAPQLAALATRARDEGQLDATFIDAGRKKTLGGGIVHVVTHSMHHRAQILIMLDLLGVAHTVEGDALGWERQQRGGWDAA